MKRYLDWFILIGLPICCWGCFWYMGIPHVIEKTLALFGAVMLLLLFFLIVIKKIPTKQICGRYVVITTLLSFVSLLNAYLYWGQAPWLTFSVGYGLYYYIYYYVLKQRHVPQDKIIKLICVFALIYAVLWSYGFLQAPDVVFGNDDTKISDDRGVFRLTVLGFDFLSLFFFYSFTRYLENLKSIKYLLCTAISFLLIFATVSRMVIATTLVVSVFYVFKKKNFKTQVIVVAIVLAFSGAILSNQVVKNLFELQETLSESGDDGLIRSEWKDSYRLFPFHIGTFLFGNGPDHIASSYGQYCNKLKENYQFHREDAGYPGHYVSYGIVAIILFLILSFRILKQKIPDEYYFYKLYFIYFLIASITTYYFYINAITLSICFYSIDQICFSSNNQLNRYDTHSNSYM